MPKAPTVPQTAAVRLPTVVVALPETGFLRQRAVLALIPFGKSTLWAKVRCGEFPSPVKLSTRVTAWDVGAVRRWIAEHGGTAA